MSAPPRGRTVHVGSSVRAAFADLWRSSRLPEGLRARCAGAFEQGRADQIDAWARAGTAPRCLDGDVRTEIAAQRGALGLGPIPGRP